MSIPCRFPSHKAAHEAGWFSRRHESDAAHRDAQDRWFAERAEKRVREQQQTERAAARKAAARQIVAA